MTRSKLARLVILVVLISLASTAISCSQASEPVSYCDALKGATSKHQRIRGSVMWGGDAAGTWTFDARSVPRAPGRDLNTSANAALPVHDMAFIASGWKLCLLDGKGNRVWSLRREGGFSVPALEDGLLVAPNSSQADTHLFAFDASRGTERWSWTQPRREDAESGFIGVPLLSRGRVYVSGSEGLFSINAADGKTIWRDSAGASASLAVRNDTIYATDGKVLRFLDAQSGAERASVAVTARSIVAGPRFIYAENKNGLAAYDPVSGRLQWQSGVRILNDEPAMALTGNILAVVGFEYDADGRADLNHKPLFGLNASTGRILWRYATTEGVGSTPSSADGVIYAGNGDGLLVAVDALSGRQLWKVRIEIETHLAADAPPQAGPTTQTIEGSVSWIMPGDESLYVLGRSWRISESTRDGALYLYR